MRQYWYFFVLTVLVIANFGVSHHMLLLQRRTVGCNMQWVLRLTECDEIATAAGVIHLKGADSLNDYDRKSQITDLEEQVLAKRMVNIQTARDRIFRVLSQMDGDFVHHLSIQESQLFDPHLKRVERGVNALFENSKHLVSVQKEEEQSASLNELLNHQYDDVLQSLNAFRSSLRASRQAYMVEQIALARKLWVVEWIFAGIILSIIAWSFIYYFVLEKRTSRAETKSRALSLEAKISSIWADGAVLTDTLQFCGDSIIKHLDVAMVRIWLLNTETGAVELAADVGACSPKNGTRFAIEQSGIEQIIWDWKPRVIFPFVEKERLDHSDWADREGVISFAVYPLLADGGILGAVTLFSRRVFAEFALSAMESVGRIIAMGVISRQEELIRIQSLQRQNQMNQLQQKLLAPATLSQKLQMITDGVVKTFGVDFCRVWCIAPGDLCNHGCTYAVQNEGRSVCEHHEHCLHLLASSGRYTHIDGPGHRRVPIGAFKIGKIAAGERHKLLINDVTHDPEIHHPEWARELGLISFAGFQLRVPQGETLGVMAVFSKKFITSEEATQLDAWSGTTTQVIRAAQAEKEQAQIQTQLNQAQKLESIGQLSAGIAHEINTPMQYIGDNTHFVSDALRDITPVLENHRQLLEAFKQNTVTAEMIEVATEAVKKADLDYLMTEMPQAIEQSLNGVDRVVSIVRAMKEFSHPGLDSKVATDLNHAIESTIVVARNEWKYVADLETDFDPAMPLVSCFPGEFNQVILNLIINAAHAIEEVQGGRTGAKGKIIIQTRCLSDKIEVRVSDTGSGIPEAIRMKIFDSFFTTKKVGKGTGQGLALAHSVIVKKHGGTISFETTIGVGTTFIVQLPI